MKKVVCVVCGCAKYIHDNERLDACPRCTNPTMVPAWLIERRTCHEITVQDVWEALERKPIPTDAAQGL